MCRDENENVFYVHETTGESRWVHPDDEGTEWAEEQYNNVPENETELEVYAEHGYAEDQYVGEAWAGNQEYQYQEGAAGDWSNANTQDWGQQQNTWDGHAQQYDQYQEY